MREIKFRGQRLDNKELAYGYYCVNKKEHFIFEADWITNKGSLLGAAVEVDPATVGQFTGLLDKNGKEIYEGDRIKYEEETDIFVVRWHPAYFCAGGILMAGELHSNICDLPCTIIGNIYENPELK